jgi:hypothetical protein
MQHRFPLLEAPQPRHEILIESKYVVVYRDGACLSFDLENGNAYNREHHSSLRGLMQYKNNWQFHFIDPISAVWMGIVTVEDLGLSEQTLAVLKLAMQDVIP